YRLVWSSVQRIWVVAGELARGKTKAATVCAAVALTGGAGAEITGKGVTGGSGGAGIAGNNLTLTNEGNIVGGEGGQGSGT
ncbi:ESPR-type extended signal peptide-containing protein, partial [Enterobacter ludwigii]|uniref:ESPR-type extended signal peptide-containing protein n=1 Tax=Enterobacter ludwigii TaxID=299767 RepID=UPI0039755AF7